MSAPWSCHPVSPLKWKASSHEDELCHHSHATWNKTTTSCTCFHNSSSNQACYSPCSSQVHQVHQWLDKGVPGLIHRHWQICWQIQDPTPTWCASHAACPQEMPHHLVPKGQGTPWQDAMPGSDHLSRWANGLDILHYLHSEGKWKAMPVLGFPWPQWGHLLRSSQDAHCGGSCSWVCALSILCQVGCLSWILVNCPWPGVQVCLWHLKAHLEDNTFCNFPLALSVPKTSSRRRWIRSWKSAKDAWNHRQHHHPWLHWGGTWCPPTKPHTDHLQIWFGVQSTKNTCEG